MIREKDYRWLEECAHIGGGMYAGLRGDLLPAGPKSRLDRAGLIVCQPPSNPIHKDRWVASEAGHAALRARKAALIPGAKRR